VKDLPGELLRVRRDFPVRKAMLAREVVEELVGSLRAARLHVLDTLPDGRDRLLIVLTLPLEILG
jgi:hypothetical protein